ncbi:MAG: pyrroline-5-carboxylate reductase [Clostridium sp.]|jgi:pyrroline-5-carboxylate reductase
MVKIGFIGMGNIGYAIMRSLLHVYDKEEITFTDLNRRRVAQVEKETGIKAVASNQECAAVAKCIVLAVKPQFYDAVLKDIKDTVTHDNIIISIAPGISIDSVNEKLGGGRRIVRAMPNTPALLGEGMTGVCYDQKQFEEVEKQMITSFFESFGKMEILPEYLMNAVVCISASAPAYIYMFIEALADAGVKYGMPRDMAYRMAAQGVVGSAKMVLETGKHPGALKDEVCSPGGTTIYAVAMLEEYGLRNAVIKACDACYEKCIDM